MTNLGAEIIAALRISLASLPYRLGSSAVIVAGVALTVAVMVSMLALSAGLERTYSLGGNERLALVLSREATFEWNSALSRADVGAIESAPGVQRAVVGDAETPLVSPEVDLQLPPVAGVADGSLRVRGVRPAGLSAVIRPHFRILSGRPFRPGAHELLIGRAVARVHGAKIGDSVLMADGVWPIVGTFADGGSIAEGQLLGDAETLMASSSVESFGSVRVALTDPARFDAFADWIAESSGFHGSAERLDGYLDRVGRLQAESFRTMAYAMGLMMALGALFACAKILYASVRARSREIGTLRAIGFAPWRVATSIVVEAVLLSLAGAAVGAAAAWALFDGRHASDYDLIFDLAVGPRVVLAGVVLALAIALLGSLAPAVRTARLRVVDALRDA